MFTPELCVAFNFWVTCHPRARLRPTMLFLHSDEYARSFASRVSQDDAASPFQNTAALASGESTGNAEDTASATGGFLASAADLGSAEEAVPPNDDDQGPRVIGKRKRG